MVKIPNVFSLSCSGIPYTKKVLANGMIILSRPYGVEPPKSIQLLAQKHGGVVHRNGIKFDNVSVVFSCTIDFELFWRKFKEIS